MNEKKNKDKKVKHNGGGGKEKYIPEKMKEEER